MTTLLGPLLAVALMAQTQGGMLEGTVVDDRGNPVAGAQIVFRPTPPHSGKADPVVVETKTDAEGRFRLTVPPPGRVPTNGAHVWAYRPGLALTAVPSDRMPAALVLRKPEPKAVKIEGADGEPVASVRVSVRTLYVSGNATPEPPESLGARLGATTGMDGTATFDFLASGDQLVTVQVTADTIGTQEFQLAERPGREAQGPTVTLRLGPTSRLTGRVRTRAGQPVAGQVVEIWLKGGNWMRPNQVQFKSGPVRTAGDGSFQTPDKLLVGSIYRVVLLATAMEPIVSDWITIGAEPRVLLPMIQRPAGTISGRAVDRQGNPLAGIEVFQSGDGPERTATVTDSEGRFSLGGFRRGTVFLFAKCDGFRFFGRMIKPGDGDVTIDLTRISERPVREMKMLPAAIPLDESRALARRLIEPYWQAALANKNGVAMDAALRSMMTSDPAGVLRISEEIELPRPGMKVMIQSLLARTMAQDNPNQAEAVAKAIEQPTRRATALVAVADALLDEMRDRKLAVLDQAERAAKASPVPNMRLHLMGEVAERRFELGEKEKAKMLFAECVNLAKTAVDKTDTLRDRFAARLARVDLPSALAIVKDFSTSGATLQNSVLRNIAFHLAAENPAEAEKVLRQVPQQQGREWLPPAIAWKMAKTDPARAQSLVDESQRLFDQPQSYLFLALGLTSRDKNAAEQAFQTAMLAMDRLMKQPAAAPLGGVRWVLLPLVEQIDPALVPEYFWRIVAMRRPTGNPRSGRDFFTGRLVALLAWYDRDVAAALFEPVRDQMEQSDDRQLADASVDFLGWSTFAPREAVARLEQVPVTRKLEQGADSARLQVAEMLGLAHEERWRKVWSDLTEMRDLFERDLR